MGLRMGSVDAENGSAIVSEEKAGKGAWSQTSKLNDSNAGQWRWRSRHESGHSLFGVVTWSW